MVLSVDQASAVPVKIVGFLNETDRKDNLPSWVWEASSIELMDGHYVAKTSEEYSYIINNNRTPTVRTFAKIIVNKIEYNKVHAESIFWPEIQKTANVFDVTSSSFLRASAGKPVPAKSGQSSIQALP